MLDPKMKEFIAGLPKCELHVHIEGTMEPEMLLEKAEKNGVALPYKDIEEVRNAYKFDDLQSFLDIYYAGMSVLCDDEDFYDLTLAYMTKAHSQNVRHAEIFFDPQGHVDRLPFQYVVSGIIDGLCTARARFGMTSRLIMCFLRDRSEEEAFEMLGIAKEHNRNSDNLIKIYGVGLDSAEARNPPEKFERVFKAAKEANFFLTAHAGEEGPPEYIWSALNKLNVTRIDHGNSCMEDFNLCSHLIDNQILLTICPITNLKIKTIKSMKNHPLKMMISSGMKVCVNSDDPGYFGAYINENLEAVTEALDLTKRDLQYMSSCSIDGSRISFERKSEIHEELGFYAYHHNEGMAGIEATEWEQRLGTNCDTKITPMGIPDHSDK